SGRRVQRCPGCRSYRRRRSCCQLSDLYRLHTGFSQELIERRDLFSRPTGWAIRKNYALLRARKGYEEPSRCLILIVRKAPPSTIVKADKDDGVIFKPFPLVNSHERHRMNPLIDIQRV